MTESIDLPDPSARPRPIDRIKRFFSSAVVLAQAMEDGPYGALEKRVSELEAALARIDKQMPDGAGQP